MPTVTFKGRVFPELLKLTLSQPISLGWKNEQTGFNGIVEVTITDGVLTAKCELSKFDSNEHLALLYKEAFELSGILVNLSSFALGTGTTIVFETMTVPDGTTTEIRSADPTLAQHCTAFTLSGQSILDILDLAVKEPLIHYALRDLNDCFVPNRTTINCARVVETIRTMILPTAASASRAPAWEKMRVALNLSAGYIKFISDQSISHRHGVFDPVDTKTNAELSHRTWKIMNRFLEYRKRNNKPLTDPEFPLLS